LAEFSRLEHFDLQADVNHEAGKPAGKILPARGGAAGRAAAGVFCTRGSGLSFLLDSHVMVRLDAEPLSNSS
jgi:hypothetical protein